MKRYLLIVVFMLSIGLPIASAQEVTEVVPTIEVSTPAPTEEVTLEPVPTAAPTPTPEPDFDGTSAAELLLYVFLAIVAGGGLLAIVYRLLESKDVRDRVEKAYESWSPDQREFLLTVITKYEELNTRLLEFAKAVTDNKPNT
jgi:hypothetical protein